MKKQKYLKRWQQQHPAARVHRYLRELLTHYIGFAPGDCVPEMSGMVLDITAVMELLDILERDKAAVKLRAV